MHVLDAELKMYAEQRQRDAQFDRIARVVVSLVKYALVFAAGYGMAK